jgi:hypothetical protein
MSGATGDGVGVWAGAEEAGLTCQTLTTTLALQVAAEEGR